MTLDQYSPLLARKDILKNGQWQRSFDEGSSEKEKQTTHHFPDVHTDENFIHTRPNTKGLHVHKFGGTSLGDIGKIKGVAEKIKQWREAGYGLIGIVSAMAGFTNQLAQWTEDIAPHNKGLDHDVVLSAGEQITAGLLVLALEQLGIKARAWMGWQVPIITNDIMGNADILSISTDRILQDIEQGIIPIIAGFQGVTPQGQIRTLGRGGSDITAAAMAHFFKADMCHIFTDVDGVYTADPHILPEAAAFKEISYNDMEVLSEYGAKVLHKKAIQWLRHADLPMRICKTFSSSDDLDLSIGTHVKKETIPLKGIAHKAVDIWQFVNITPQDMEILMQSCQKLSIKLIEWQLSLRGLRIMTWRCDRALFTGFLTPESQPEELTLITILRATDNPEFCTKIHEGSKNNQWKIAPNLNIPQGLGLLVPDLSIKETINTLHTYIEKP